MVYYPKHIWFKHRCYLKSAGNAQRKSNKHAHLAELPCKDLWTSCPADSYLGDNYKTCYPCPAGSRTYSHNGVQIDLCISCPAGQYGDSLGAGCTTCAANTYSSRSGATRCSPCPPGKFSLSGAIFCFPCPAGQYGQSPGSGCTQCPSNTFSAVSFSFSLMNLLNVQSLFVSFNDFPASFIEFEILVKAKVVSPVISKTKASLGIVSINPINLYHKHIIHHAIIFLYSLIPDRKMINLINFQILLK